MWMQELKDKPVVSVAEGTKIGSVHEVLLDEWCSKVMAFQIGGGGLLGGKRQAIAYSAVRGIGPDAVMVEGRDAIEDVADDGPLGATFRQSELQQDVMSEGGVHLGHVKDAEFDPQSGAITALSFEPKGDWVPDTSDEYVVARDDIVSLTPKMAVVRHEVIAADNPDPEPSHRRDLGHLVKRSDRDRERQERTDGADTAVHDGSSASALGQRPSDVERVRS